jgi:hypothetical protein
MPGILQLLVQAIREIRQSRKAHGKTIDDPVFGQLTYNWLGSWAGTVALGEFGDEVALSISADRGEPPSDAQRSAYQALVADLSKLHTAVERANLKFYNEVVLGDWREQELRERPDERALIMRDMPDVDDASLLWKWLTYPALSIPKQEDEGWVVELAWNARWDEEHGHDVTIKNGRVKA